MSKKDEALKLALEALVDARVRPPHKQDSSNYEHAIIAIREALAEQPAQQQEPMREMPSNTRYAVAVEGQALTYWDNIHDAITNAQRAVYAGPDATCRAIDDLKAGRLAEWSYGFSAVRIYPPQNTSPPASKPWVGLTERYITHVAAEHLLYEGLPPPEYEQALQAFARTIEAKLREKNA